MDRNTVIGFILLILLFIGYSIFSTRDAARLADRERVLADSLARVDSIERIQRIKDSIRIATEQRILQESPPEVVESIRQQELDRVYGPFAETADREVTTHLLENEHLKVYFTSEGGKIENVELKEHNAFDRTPVILFEPQSNDFGFGIPISTGYIRTDSLIFETVSSDANQITFRLPAGEGRFIEHQYSLEENSFWVEYNVRLVGFQDLLARENNLTLSWNTRLRLQEREYENERQNTTIYYRVQDSEDVDYFGTGKELRQEPINLNLNWISFKQQFFNSTLLAPQGFHSADVSMTSPATDDYLKEMQANLYLPFTATQEVQYPMQFYFGPNGYNHLKAYDVHMEEMVSMGGWGLGVINKHFILPVFNFFERFTSNYGLIILFLAVFIKLILTPLTYKSYLSQAKMRVLKPELDELREKYKDDTQKIQMEQMKLYRKTGVNMMGGCLPMLLQFPILIAMYRFFPESMNLRQASFLWAEDLSTYDSIMNLPFHIPFYGAHVSLFTLLMAASSILYAWVNRSMTAASAPAQMRMLMYIMPFFLIFIFNSFSAALTYYYLLYNLLSIGQQLIFQYFVIDEDAIRRKMEENKKKPMKVSKWQKRLEEMQKIQQQKAKEQNKRKK